MRNSIRNGMILVAIMAGSTAASAKTYAIDTSHAEVGFSIRHMGISNVRGSFKTFSGSVTYDGSDITGLKADAEIEVVSIDTGNKKRDEHLRGLDFFDSAKFAKITFSSSGIKKSKDDYLLKGKLSMHGVTKEVSLPVVISGPIDDPYGNKRIGLELSGILKRHDFGIGDGGATDKLIGKDVKLDINLEGISK